MAEPELQGHVARRRALESARRSRAAILELAVRAEYVLGEALANDLAANEEAAAVLQEHMTWRVPIEVKLKLLSQAMDSHDIFDTFLPIPLRRQFRKIVMRLVSSVCTEAGSQSTR